MNVGDLPPDLFAARLGAEGVAIGGDRYPGSRFLDHLLRYEANPRVKMLVLLGEVGGMAHRNSPSCRGQRTGRSARSPREPAPAWSRRYGPIRGRP